MKWIIIIIILLIVLVDATAIRGSTNHSHVNHKPHFGHPLHHNPHPVLVTTLPPTTAPTTPTITPLTPTPYTPRPPTAYPEPTENPSDGITNQGGFVLVEIPTLYLLFYGNWASTSSGSVAILDQWASSLNGSPQQNIASMYYQQLGIADRTYFGGNQMIYGGYYVNTSYTYGVSLTDTNIYYIVVGALNQGIFPYNPLASYIVITDPTVTMTSGFCTTYCGWHTAAGYSGHSDVVYGVVGSCSNCGGCNTGSSPNNNENADSIINVLWHEWMESITDPYLSAWYRPSDFSEVADICAWNFGSTFTSSNGQWANENIGGYNYTMQQIWSIASSSSGECVQHYP